eukprot:1923493-Pyramimonas_sp.AAC.1
MLHEAPAQQDADDRSQQDPGQRHPRPVRHDLAPSRQGPRCARERPGAPAAQVWAKELHRCDQLARVVA